MFSKKDALAILIIITTILSLTCQQNGEKKEVETITIIDNRGVKVEIPKRVERIISLSPEATEIIGELNSLNLLVGVVNECDYPDKVDEIEKVGSFSSPSFEKIVSLNPDLIIATGLEQKGITDRLQDLNIPIVVFYAKSISDLKKNILLTGKIVDKEETALNEVQLFEENLHIIHKRLQDLPDDDKNPRVYLEISPDPLMTVAKGSFIHDLITTVGGENIGADLPREYCRIDPEVVIKKDPEFIIITHPASTEEDVKNRNGWNVITAVKEGNIITDLDPDILMRATPRLSEGAMELYLALHPDEEPFYLDSEE